MTTTAQLLLRTHLHELGVPIKAIAWECQFSSERKFKFDLADVDNHIGYECDGGQFSGGHMRGLRLESQYEKDRLAQILGWRIFRFTNRQIMNGEARSWLAEYVYAQSPVVCQKKSKKI